MYERVFDISKMIAKIDIMIFCNIAPHSNFPKQHLVPKATTCFFMTDKDAPQITLSKFGQVSSTMINHNHNHNH